MVFACLSPGPTVHAKPPCGVSRERDRLYERAEKVGGLLVKLGEQLKEAIADVNESTGDSAFRSACNGLGFASSMPIMQKTLKYCFCGRLSNLGAVSTSVATAPLPRSRHVSASFMSPSELSAPFACAAATLGDSSTPLSKVVRILNNQLQALTQVRSLDGCRELAWAAPRQVKWSVE